MHQAQSMPATAGATGGAVTPSEPQAERQGDRLHALVMAQLDDDQAQEVVSIPLAGKSSIADYMVVASGRSTRQVASIGMKLAVWLKKPLKHRQALPLCKCNLMALTALYKNNSPTKVLVLQQWPAPYKLHVIYTTTRVAPRLLAKP